MPPLLIAATRPTTPGFLLLRSESLVTFQYAAARRELAKRENPLQCAERKLLSAFVGGQLVGGCGLNVDLQPGCRTRRIRHLYISDAFRRRKIVASSCWWPSSPSGTWFDFLNTHAPPSAYWPFMNRLDFARFMMSRGSRIACSVRFKRGWPGENAVFTVPGPGHSPAPCHDDNRFLRSAVRRSAACQLECYRQNKWR